MSSWGWLTKNRWDLYANAWFSHKLKEDLILLRVKRLGK